MLVSCNPTAEFAAAVANAGRIVIHAHGFDEYEGEPRKIFLGIIDPRSIREFNSKIEFKRTWGGGQCACLGFPGIDWYQNGERIVYTELQHKERIRWSRFEYDLPLTDSSAAWLESYLAKRNVAMVGTAVVNTAEQDKAYQDAIRKLGDKE